MSDLDRRDGRWIAALVRVVRPLVFLWFGARVHGTDSAPDRPVLFVANHGGAMTPADMVFWLHWCSRPDHTPVYVLAHRMFTRLGPLRRLLARFGVIEGSPDNAGAALAAGGHVLVFPGGDHDSLRSWSRRHEVDFGGRQGFLRLARDAGVPMVPVVSAGSHNAVLVVTQGKGVARALRLPRIGLHSFPVMLCLPWGVLVGPMVLLPCLPFPARIDVVVGPALDPPPPETGDDALDGAYHGVVEGMTDTLRNARARR